MENLTFETEWVPVRAAKLDHLSKLKVGWQKLKVDLESCWKVVSTEFESELADSDLVW